MVPRHVASGCDRGYAKISDRNYAKSPARGATDCAFDSAPNHGESRNVRARARRGRFLFLSSSSRKEGEGGVGRGRRGGEGGS